MLAVDYLLADPKSNYNKVMDIIEKTTTLRCPPSQRQAIANAVKTQNSFYDLMMHVLQLTPDIRDTLLKNLIVDCNLMAWDKREEMRALHGCNIPWAILLDPTSACNLQCTGCWSASSGPSSHLSFEDMDSIITQGKALGVHLYLYSGGEPLLRKSDLIEIAKKHRDCAFLCFTNGTLVDEDFCREMVEMKNFITAISIEGRQDATDARRGEGSYARAVAAMETLRLYGLPYGVSCCVTSENIGAIASDEYVDALVGTGALFMWLFEYIPLGQGAPAQLMLNAEQREMLHSFVAGMRETKPLLILDFQDDSSCSDGHRASEHRCLHIGASGDINPRALTQHPGTNIRDCSLLDALKSNAITQDQ